MRPLLASLALVAAGQGARTAVFSNGAVEARGGCEARPEGVTCWDMEGKPASELAEGLRLALGSGGGEVVFRLGKKNRYLVARRPQALQPQYRMGRDGYLSAISIYNVDPALDYIRIAAEPDAGTATLTVQTTVPSAKDDEIPLREGATAQVEGRKIEIGATARAIPTKGRPINSPVSGQPVVGPVWSVVIGLSGDDSLYTGWSFIPLDKMGQPIRYVDAVGNPITALKALALEPSLQANGFYSGNGPPPPKPKASAAYFQGWGGTAFRATTNVDPKAVASLRIKAGHLETKEIGPFPLDPIGR